MIKRLNNELMKVLRSDEFKARMEDSGSEPHANSPEEFAAFISSERVKWGNIIKTTGIKWQE